MHLGKMFSPIQHLYLGLGIHHTQRMQVRKGIAWSSEGCILRAPSRSSDDDGQEANMGSNEEFLARIEDGTHLELSMKPFCQKSVPSPLWTCVALTLKKRQES